MKKLLFIPLMAIALFASSAQAVDLEIGIGATQFNDRGNGIWYQEGFPYSLNLKSANASIGLVGDISNSVRWHAAYVYVGHVKSDAMATPVDENYSLENHSCIGECVGMSRFVGDGNLQGIKLTAEPHMKIFDADIGIEFGPFFYVPKWDMTVYDWVQSPTDTPQTIHVSAKSGIHIGAVLGATITKGNVSVYAGRVFAPGYGNPYSPIWKTADMVEVKYRF